MALEFVKTTALDAVNICLGAVGEQPVSEIGSGISKATIAEGILHEISREIQTQGLYCNTDEALDFTPDVDDEIALPANCLSVDPTYLSDNRYVERTSKLYDREDATFTITKTVKLDIIYFLEWTDLPEHVRRYITIKAARIFQKRYLADESMHRFTVDEELLAKNEFERKELNIGDFTLFDNLNVNPRVHRRG